MLYKEYMKNSWNIKGCQSAISKEINICPIFAQYLSNICTIYIRYLHNIYSISKIAKGSQECQHVNTQQMSIFVWPIFTSYLDIFPNKCQRDFNVCIICKIFTQYLSKINLGPLQYILHLLNICLSISTLGGKIEFPYLT